MGKAKSLLDDVLATAASCRFGPAAWVEKLPADLRAEVEQVKHAYKTKAVDVRKNALARALKAAVEQRGFPCVNQAGVVRWLDQN